jgi:hypothetical protein
MTSMRSLGAAAFAAALAAGLAGSGPAMAEGEPLRAVSPKPGLEVWYAPVENGKVNPKKITSRQRILRIDGEDVVYRIVDPPKNGRPGVTDNLRAHLGIVTYYQHRVGRGVRFDQLDKAAWRAVFPMAPGGKTVTTKAKRFLGAAATLKAAWEKAAPWGEIVYTVRTVKRERVTVPAGTFDTVVLEKRWVLRKADGTQVDAGRRHTWFAPKLGWFVKLDFLITEGKSKGYHSGLEALTIKNGPTAK